MTFHRLTPPSYFGGLPGGYDYINNAVAGTPAFAEGIKLGGPNAGTYFVAFGEDATSADANRPAKALSENTDYLDDLLHRDIAVPVRSSDGVGAPTATITLTGPGIFLGLVGAQLKDLFHVTDDKDQDIEVGVGGGVVVQVVATAAVDAGAPVVPVGGGFSNGNVTVTFNPPIPAGQPYRLYYATRSNFAVFPADGLTNTRIRNLTQVDYLVEEQFRLLQGPTASGLPWNGGWYNTIKELTLGGLHARYSLASGEDFNAIPLWPAPENHFPPFGPDSPGAGGWIRRWGPALTVYADGGGALGNAYTDPLNALFAAKFFDTAPENGGGAVGFATYGARQTGTAWTGETLNHTPGAAGLMHLWPHYFQPALHASNPYTRIQDGATATLAYHGAYDLNTGELILTVTQAGNYFREAVSGQSAVSLGRDLVAVTYTVGPQTYQRIQVIVAHGETGDLSNAQKVRLRNLDGTVWHTTGVPATVSIRWISTTLSAGDGAGSFHSTLYGYSNGKVLLDGLFYQTPQHLSKNAGDDDVTRTAPFFSAASTDYADYAFQWGGYSHTLSAARAAGSLRGDGSIVVNDISANDVTALKVDAPTVGATSFTFPTGAAPTATNSLEVTSINFSHKGSGAVANSGFIYGDGHITGSVLTSLPSVQTITANGLGGPEIFVTADFSTEQDGDSILNSRPRYGACMVKAYDGGGGLIGLTRVKLPRKAEVGQQFTLLLCEVTQPISVADVVTVSSRTETIGGTVFRIAVLGDPAVPQGIGNTLICTFTCLYSGVGLMTDYLTTYTLTHISVPDLTEPLLPKN